MKNIIVLLLTAFLSFSVSSQSTYNKMLVADTTIWNHFNCFIPVIAPGQQQPITNFAYFPVIAIDTITLFSGVYKKVYEIPSFTLNYSNKQLRGYMREDTIAKKVFFKETWTSADLLLYDFSLNIGDSAMYIFPYNATLNGYYRVDSIKTKTEMCGPRKHFYLWKHSTTIFPGSSNYLEHIESIGSKFHALYNYNFNPGGSCLFNTNSSQACYHPWQIGLACKSDNKSKKYQSCTISIVNPCIAYYDSCNYGTVCGGLRNYKLNKDVTIFPNPTKNKLTITINLEATETVEIKVFDIAGKELLSYKNILFNVGENTYELNTSRLENGVYSVVIENQHFKNSYPVVIQN